MGSQWIYEFAPAALRQTRLVPGDGKHTTHKKGGDWLRLFVINGD
jgi:hypothetical protein